MQVAVKCLENALVAKLEGPALGVLCELVPKPVRLKREMQKLFDSTPDNTWKELHPIVQDTISILAPPAAKKPKHG